MKREKSLIHVSEAKLPTEFGEFKITGFENSVDNDSIVVLSKGSFNHSNSVLVRVHSSCITGDIFHSLRCDCGDQLKGAMSLVAEKEEGLIIYLNQEGRGIGILNKIKAYNLQDGGLDTVEANEALHLPIDSRDYKVVPELLEFFKINKISLITNNPDKKAQLEEYGVQIENCIPSQVEFQKERENYLKTKKEKLGHFFHGKD